MKVAAVILLFTSAMALAAPAEDASLVPDEQISVMEIAGAATPAAIARAASPTAGTSTANAPTGPATTERARPAVSLHEEFMFGGLSGDLC
ncbi:hypothetical protein E4U55_001882 [Claviceps digitariae]|nr:hypothetical protein E4U55_001882 [Claviceps digitariae]